MSGDESVKTGLQQELNNGIEALQTQLEAAKETLNALTASLDALTLQLSELEKIQAEDSKAVAAELKAINEALNISRSIQDVQVAFGDLKNRLEDSKTRLGTQELLLRQLDGQVSKSERNNLLIEQDIQQLEGRMQELLKVMEKRQKSRETQQPNVIPEKEENPESATETETQEAAEG